MISDTKCGADIVFLKKSQMSTQCRNYAFNYAYFLLACTMGNNSVLILFAEPQQIHSTSCCKRELRISIARVFARVTVLQTTRVTGNCNLLPRKYFQNTTQKKTKICADGDVMYLFMRKAFCFAASLHLEFKIFTKPKSSNIQKNKILQPPWYG